MLHSSTEEDITAARLGRAEVRRREESVTVRDAIDRALAALRDDPTHRRLTAEERGRFVHDCTLAALRASRAVAGTADVPGWAMGNVPELVP